MPIAKWLISLVVIATLAWMVSTLGVRAIAQNAEPPEEVRPAAKTTPAAAAQTSGDVDTNEAEVGPRRAPPPRNADEDPRELRDSADNNASFPIDI